MYLDELNINECARVISISGNDNERQCLLSMGIFPDAILSVVKKAPLGDPIEINIHDYNLAIRTNHAKNIKVNKIEINDKEFLKSNDHACDDFDLYNFTNHCKYCNKNCFINDKKNNFTNNKTDNHNLDLYHTIYHPGLGEDGIFHDKKILPVLPENKNICFALVGNQNCGKTTLFNALTGSNQHVGNFPGVTIDRKDGKILRHKNTKITDLPGIYSLSPFSKEEIITRDFILYNDIDCIINIVDATNLERSFYLTMQLMQLEHPMIIALNMLDELRHNKTTIYVNKLEKLFGIPVVPISAKNKEGVDELIDHALHIAKFQELPIYHDFCKNDKEGGATHNTIHAIMHIIDDYCKNDGLNFPIKDSFSHDKNVAQFHKHIIPVRFAAEKIVEKDWSIMKLLNLDENSKHVIEHLIKDLEDISKLDSTTCIAKMRYRFILNLCSKCVIKENVNKIKKRSDILDKFLTGKFTALPIFLCIMLLIFYITFNVLGKFLQNILSSIILYFSEISIKAMESVGINSLIVEFVKNAIFEGIGTILSFMPIIIIMFFFLSLLEDSGYMARIAFVMDKLLRKIGLSGKSIVPLLIGFGCSVPAIMSTRTLTSEKDRKRTILLISYMSCSAKLPIYGFICTLFFKEYAAIAMILIYIFGIFMGILFAVLTKGKSKPVPFIMELPNYRIPTFTNVVRLLWDKSKDFIQRAFSVILIATIIIWFLQSFSFEFIFAENPQNSILSTLAGFISPIFSPIGLGDWKIVTSFISGFLAKESIVSTLLLLTNSDISTFALLTFPMAISFLVFTLLYTPCIASISSINKELGFKWAVFVVLVQCIVAWITAYIIFNICILVF